MGKIRQRNISRVFKTATSLEIKMLKRAGGLEPSSMEYYFTLVQSLLLYVCGVVSVFAKFSTIFVIIIAWKIQFYLQPVERFLLNGE